MCKHEPLLPMRGGRGNFYHTGQKTTIQRNMGERRNVSATSYSPDLAHFQIRYI